MVGMKQENEVERLDRFRFEIVILMRQREHHVEDIGGVRQYGRRINDGESQGRAKSKSGDGARLREQAGGLNFELFLGLGGEEFGIETAGGIDHRGKDRHGMGGDGESLEMV